MPKYLAMAKYSPGDQVKSLIADGGTSRARVVEEFIASFGGKLERFYYAIGEVDAYIVIDMPDEASAIAASLTVNARGMASVSMVKLIEPAQIDEAVKKSPLYDAPGPTA